MCDFKTDIFRLRNKAETVNDSVLYTAVADCLHFNVCFMKFLCIEFILNAQTVIFTAE